MSMSLKPEDIDTIEEAGILDGQPVKLARTRGGFWLGICNGKVLSGGSHPAIVKHTIGKMHPNFQPVMCKSEAFSDAIVDRHSHFLSDELRKSGHDIYSIQTNDDIEFQITKHNLKIASIHTRLQDKELYIPELNIPKEFTRALAGATTEKAIACNSKAIKVK
jgi:hypothetical protein